MVTGSLQQHTLKSLKNVGNRNLRLQLHFICYVQMGSRGPRAEVYGCAADRDQASLVFDVACDMVRLSPALMKRCDLRPSRKTIGFGPTNSSYKVFHRNQI